MRKTGRFRMRALFALAAMVLSTGAIAAHHALLIGVSEYEEPKLDGQAAGEVNPTLHNLPGATKDVAIVEEVLKSRLGFQPSEMRILLNRAATHTGIERAFADLAAAVQPGDVVYIHYSGHGSLVTDYNDKERSGKDQTLVGYGARWQRSEGLDRYDILDDELNQWLAPIADKAGELVVVADSCHSASNTRGESMLVSRAAPADDQGSHPRAHDSVEPHPLTGAIRIGAARDDQSAYEYPQADGSRVGLFTWQWVAALSQADPTDTWRRVFERASLGVTTEQGPAQRPQITGEQADRQILGGKLDPRPAVMVTDVRGDTVTLNAGSLSGVTVGSLYARSGAQDAAKVRIESSNGSSSTGRIESGTLTKGDFLAEHEHAYATAPVKLYAFPIDDPRDQPLAEALRARLAKLPGFVWVDAQKDSDLALAVLRPKREAGVPQFQETPKGRETFPIVAPDAVPEVWVMNPAERLLHDNLAVRLDPAEQGMDALVRNLDRYRRATELRRLTAEGGGKTGVKLALIPYESCDGPALDCFRVPDTKTWHRPGVGTLPIERLTDKCWPEGTLVSFALENSGLRDSYVYLLDLGPDGAVRVVFPPTGQSAEAARISPGGKLELPDADVGLMLDAPGDVSLLVLATQYPIDPRFLTQEGYEQHRSASTKGELRHFNALESLLVDAVQGTGTRTGVSMGTGTWAGTLIDYRVAPKEVPTKEMK